MNKRVINEKKIRVNKRIFETGSLVLVPETFNRPKVELIFENMRSHRSFVQTNSKLYLTWLRPCSSPHGEHTRDPCLFLSDSLGHLGLCQ
jgi:hypothetical protein